MTKKTKKKRIMLWIIIAILLVVGVVAFISLNWLTTTGYDYTELTWTEAFDQLHMEVSQKYPFTEWKNIDWDELYAQTAPRIAEAEANNDPAAYYLALREYTFSIPDAHVQLGGPDLGLRQQAIEGGYGFGIIGLDDGRVIAHILLEDGPAQKAGMIWGAEILEWDGLPIQEALAQTSIIWAENSTPTTEGNILEKYHFLPRDPLGTEIVVTFQNPNTEETQSVSLTAVTDDLATLKDVIVTDESLRAVFQSPIQYEILDGNVGYIHISGFMPTLGGMNMARIFDKAIKDFLKAGVSGIIIDVRDNGGGIDALVPKMVGHFYSTPGFYEDIASYNPEIDQFEIDPSQTYLIEPREPYFDGPVFVLVGKDTFSTAEGIPLAIQPLEQGYVVGMYGTNGSFAMGEPGENLYRMPNELGFSFLRKQSLNEDGMIQVDSNSEGIGGITPDIKVPLTEENIYRMYVEGVDIVLESALLYMDGMQ